MRLRKSMSVAIVGVAAVIALAGCTTDPSVTVPDEGTTDTIDWFDQVVYDKQNAERSVVPEGPDGKPYLQYINPEFVDTSAFASDGAKKVCFANASISNPWRVTGWITMNQQLKVLQDSGAISEMETRDAQD